MILYYIFLPQIFLILSLKFLFCTFLATFDKSMLQNKYSLTFSYFFLFYDKLISYTES